MKLKSFFTFLCSIMGFFSFLQASHYMGAEVTYECLGSCNYRIYQRFYLDCSGGASSPNMPVNAGNPYPSNTLVFKNQAGTTLNPPPTGSSTLVNWEEVTPVCPGTTTWCNTVGGGSISGVAEAIYYQDYNFCNLGTNLITIEFSNCCRNYAITSGQGGNAISVSTTIDLTTTTCNSSPYFLQPPITYICSSTSSIYQGAQDPDGDSLSYALGNCYNSVNAIATYNPGYTPLQPLGTSWNVAMNPTTGIVSFAPMPGNIEIANMCIEVTEWRKINGTYTQIGKIARDIQITVLNCPNANNSPHPATASASNAGISNVAGGMLSMGNLPTITVNPNSTASFQFSIDDADATGTTPTQILEMSWVQNVAGITFSNAANPSQTNVITGFTGLTANVTWQAPASGSYLLIINTKDNNCPIPAQYTQAIILQVGCYPTINVAKNLSNCNQLHLEVTPNACMIPPLNFQWTGISPTPNTNGGFDYTFPNVGTYNYSVIVTDANGSSAYYASSTTVAAPPAVNAGNDFTLCSGLLGTLGTTGQANLSYQWTSNPPNMGFLGSTNIAQPSISANLQGNMIIPVTYTLTATNASGCVGKDSAIVTFIATPNSSFSIDTTTSDSCLLLTFTGMQYPNAIYHWLVNGSVSMSGTGAGPYTVCYNNVGTYNIGLWVGIPNACNSSTTTQTYSFSPTAKFKISAAYSAVNTPVSITYQGIAKANSSFAWNFNGGTVLSGSGAGPYQVSWANTGAKNVSLTLTTPDYPTVSSTQSVLIVATDTEKPFGVSDISLSPNPATHLLNVQFTPPSAKESDIELMNAMGQKLQQWHFAATKEVKLQADVRDLPKGIYFVNIKVGEKAFLLKWVKE